MCIISTFPVALGLEEREFTEMWKTAVSWARFYGTYLIVGKTLVKYNSVKMFAP